MKKNKMTDKETLRNSFLFPKTLFHFLPSFIIVFFALIYITTILVFDGTGDAGDGLLHYLYARYAPLHPALFFDHWAKPIYVLLASPFAQFGIVGIKIFNMLATLFTLWFSYKSAEKMQFKNAWFVPLLLGFAPLYYSITFSGLTEPLFALFIALSLYFFVSKKYLIACIILSFLPLVRSEGLIMVSVFAFYLLYNKQFKFIPYLLFGSLIYSLAGYAYHHDLLWVFSKIPYAKLSSTYGHGELFHFVKQLIYVLGIPFYLLFCWGLLTMIYQCLMKKIEFNQFILLVLGFGAFFLAHSLFWYLGIFNSMGLNRVLICVLPLAALIALYGFNTLNQLTNTKLKIGRIIQFVIVLYLIIFPFTSNPAAIDWNKEMKLSNEQKLIQKISTTIKKRPENVYPILCNHPYLSETLQMDHFDTNKRMNLNVRNFNHLKKGSLILWENWFSIVEQGVTKEQLTDNKNLEKLNEWSTWNDDRKVEYVLFRMK